MALPRDALTMFQESRPKSQPFTLSGMQLRNTPFLLLPTLLIASTGAFASLNMPVASRVVGFAQLPGGPINAAIIFEPGDAASEAEAASIEQQIGNGLSAGRGTIRARRVAATSLGSLAGVRVAFVTSGVRERQQVADAASRGSILTITSDLGCVQAAKCVVAVTGSAQPQITISRVAAKAAGIRFGSAFLMLVKEI